jgi:hypothetical protein
MTCPPAASRYDPALTSKKTLRIIGERLLGIIYCVNTGNCLAVAVSPFPGIYQQHCTRRNLNGGNIR